MPDTPDDNTKGASGSLREQPDQAHSGPKAQIRQKILHAMERYVFTNRTKAVNQTNTTKTHNIAST